MMWKRIHFHSESETRACAVRRDALLTAMRKYFPHGVTWHSPKAEASVWVNLPKEIDTAELLEWAECQGLTFMPVEDGHKGMYNAIRLHYTHLDVVDIEEGIRRLAEIIIKYYHLVHQFNEAGALHFVGP